MSDDKEVTVEVTPQDMEFRARAKAVGLPDMLISMYGTALRRLVDDEREACAKRLEAIGCDHCAANIRARSQP